MIDWKDPKREDVIHFVMVDPNNLDEIFGDIDYVQLGSSTITYGYYTDTRYSSSISFLKDNNYVDNMWIRIIHEVPSEGYSNELGTFIPVSPSIKYSGAVTNELDLQSPLWGLTDNLTTSTFSIGKGSNYLTAFKKVCDNCNRPYILNNPNDYKSEKAVAYDPGTSYLDILFDLSDATNNRIDIDGHGRITLSPFVEQNSVSPTWELDADDPRSIIIQDSIEMESQSEDNPNRTIVVCGSYIGVADLPDGSEYSYSQRGYIKAETYSLSGIKSKEQAQKLAKSYLDSYYKITQWNMDTLYFPAKCGDNVTFTLNGEKHICMIQNIDPLNLDTMTMSITLKEVADE